MGQVRCEVGGGLVKNGLAAEHHHGAERAAPDEARDILAIPDPAVDVRGELQHAIGAEHHSVAVDPMEVPVSVAAPGGEVPGWLVVGRHRKLGVGNGVQVVGHVRRVSPVDGAAPGRDYSRPPARAFPSLPEAAATRAVIRSGP